MITNNANNIPIDNNTKPINDINNNNNNNSNNNNKEIKRKPGNPLFVKGNKYGINAAKGIKKRDIKALKEVIAREFAAQILATDPKTGKLQNVESIRKRLAKEAAKSPRILNLFLDHWLGQPPQIVHQEQRIVVMPALPEQYAIPTDSTISQEMLPSPADIEIAKIENISVNDDDKVDK